MACRYRLDLPARRIKMFYQQLATRGEGDYDGHAKRAGGRDGRWAHYSCRLQPRPRRLFLSYFFRAARAARK